MSLATVLARRVGVDDRADEGLGGRRDSSPGVAWCPGQAVAAIAEATGCCSACRSGSRPTPSMISVCRGRGWRRRCRFVEVGHAHGGEVGVGEQLDRLRPGRAGEENGVASSRSPPRGDRRRLPRSLTSPTTIRDGWRLSWGTALAEEPGRRGGCWFPGRSRVAAVNPTGIVDLTTMTAAGVDPHDVADHGLDRPGVGEVSHLVIVRGGGDDDELGLGIRLLQDRREGEIEVFLGEEALDVGIADRAASGAQERDLGGVDVVGDDVGLWRASRTARERPTYEVPTTAIRAGRWVPRGEVYVGAEG